MGCYRLRRSDSNRTRAKSSVFTAMITNDGKWDYACMGMGVLDEAVLLYSFDAISFGAICTI